MRFGFGSSTAAPLTRSTLRTRSSDSRSSTRRPRGAASATWLPPSPLVVHDEDQEAEAAYQVALAPVVRESEEEERCKEEEDEAYQAHMADAMALSAADGCVVPPLRPPSPVKAEPVPTPIENYSWDGVVREWVDAPPVWYGATLMREKA